MPAMEADNADASSSEALVSVACAASAKITRVSIFIIDRVNDRGSCAMVVSMLLTVQTRDESETEYTVHLRIPDASFDRPEKSVFSSRQGYHALCVNRIENLVVSTVRV